MSEHVDILDQLTASDYEYEYGFESQIEEEVVPPGLNEETIRLISEKRESQSGCSSGDCRHSATGKQ